MIFQKVKNVFTHITSLLFLIVLVLSSSCAKKPWLKHVDESLDTSIRNTLTEITEKRKACITDFNAEIIISWSSTFDKKSFSGILQILPPTHAKLVTLNPLGQTILALATDGKSFQTVNTLKREYAQGTFKSFVLRYDLPAPLLSGNLVYWLTGYVPLLDNEPTSILNDSQARGYWIVRTIENNYIEAKEYLLIDSLTHNLLTRIITDLDENVIAKVGYSDWLEHGNCQQPTNVLISKLSTGFKASIQLKDFIWENSYTKEDFHIASPPNYIQRQFH